MGGEPFRYRVTCGWLRDLASEPTPHDPWPCIRWDEALLADQMRFLDAQAELGITCNVKLVAPKELARTEGKAIRVVDKRTL